MRILGYILLSFFMLSPAFADDSPRDAMLNKITFKLTADQWVQTKSALVTMGVNASTSGSGLQGIQDEVLKKLAGIAAQGDWHIMSFDRSQDQSGLEKVQMSAQARLPSDVLANLRDKAKALSKPGETFTLDNVEFVPSAEELRDANDALRSVIYMEAKEELERVNKMYPEQKYFVHGVDFVNDFTRVPMPMMAGNMMAMRSVPASSGNNTSLAVGNKLTLTATVVLSSLTDHGLLKTLT
jgi:hypothetical protein